MKEMNSSRGFTILELIGVLFVASLIMAATVPSIFSLIKTQKSVEDAKNLKAVGESLRQGIIREKQFPAVTLDNPPTASVWWKLASRNGGGAEKDVLYSHKADIERRIYYYSPSFNDGEVTFDAFTGNGFPNQSPQQLETKFDDLRIIILSTISKSNDLKLPTISEFGPSFFDKMWDDSQDLSDVNLVADINEYGLSEAWIGNTYLLNISKLDFRNLISKVSIQNNESFDGTGIGIVKLGSVILDSSLLTNNFGEFYFLKGQRLTLQNPSTLIYNDIVLTKNIDYLLFNGSNWVLE